MRKIKLETFTWKEKPNKTSYFVLNKLTAIKRIQMLFHNQNCIRQLKLSKEWIVAILQKHISYLNMNGKHPINLTWRVERIDFNHSSSITSNLNRFSGTFSVFDGAWNDVTVGSLWKTCLKIKKLYNLMNPVWV